MKWLRAKPQRAGELIVGCGKDREVLDLHPGHALRNDGKRAG